MHNDPNLAEIKHRMTVEAVCNGESSWARASVSIRKNYPSTICLLWVREWSMCFKPVFTKQASIQHY